MKVVRRHFPWRKIIASGMRLCFPRLGPVYWRTERKKIRLHMVSQGWEYFSAEEHAMWAPGEMPSWGIIQTGPKSWKVTV